MVIVAGDAQSGIVGQELPDPLVVRVTDSAGRPVSGQLVNFRVTAGGGSVFAGAGLTNGTGQVQERWTLGNSVADTQRVEARAVDPVTGARLVFAVFRATPLAAAPATMARLAGDSQITDPGEALAESVAVILRDDIGNPVPGVTVTWTPAPGNGTASPGAKATDAAGIARTLWMPAADGGNSLSATAGSLPAVSFHAGVRQLYANVRTDGDLTCGVTLAGQAYCWGSGSSSSLGTTANTDCGAYGSFIYCPLPLPVTGNLTFSSVDPGGNFHTCGVTTAGAGYCWGQGQFGQLGIGSNPLSSLPVAVSGGYTFAELQAGSQFTCGRTTAGAVYCWGKGLDGRLGSPDSSNANVPKLVTGGLTFVALSVGTAHACAIAQDTFAYCWGSNYYGQLGRGFLDSTVAETGTPRKVNGTPALAAIAAGDNETCAFTTNGAAYCWGNNFAGQLGATTSEFCKGAPCSTTPVQVSGSLVFTSLSAGGGYVCGLVAGGTGYCWGSNFRGQLGTGTFDEQVHAAPELVTGGIAFVALNAGRATSCGVTAAGAAYCWGDNYYGETGRGTVSLQEPTKQRVTATP